MASELELRELVAQMERGELTAEEESKIWQLIEQMPADVAAEVAQATPPQPASKRGRPRKQTTQAPQATAPHRTRQRAMPGLKDSASATAETLTEPSPEPTGESTAEDTRRGAKPTKLEKQLVNFYFSIGVTVSWLNARDGTTIVSQAEARAHEVTQYAQHHPAFKEWLEHLIERSDLVVLLAGHAQLGSAIMANHGMLPQDIGRTLKAELKTRMQQRAERQDAKRAARTAATSGLNGSTPETGYPYTPIPRDRA
jgi:hypothetical protein